MIQYEMYFTNEYIEEIVYELADILGLSIEKKSIGIALGERDKSSVNNVLILKGKDCFLCIDCNDRDWIYPLVVKCQEEEASKIKEIMLKWDNMIREEYGQEKTEDIRNVYGKETICSIRFRKIWCFCCENISAI